MNIGRLRNRVTIQRLAPGQDEYGQPLQVWENYAVVWAEVKDVSGREYFESRQIPTSSVTTKVTIRYRSGLDAGMRVVGGKRVLNIQSIIDPDGKKRELLLMCEEAR